MTASKLDIIIDNEDTDYSMTVIAGIESGENLIVASDGLAGHTLRGLEHLGKEVSFDTEKVWTVKPNIIMGVSGSKVNWLQRLRRDITAYANSDDKLSIENIANEIPGYIQKLYEEQSKDPEFFIAIYIAGYSIESKRMEQYVINGDNVSTWGHELNHPWVTIGNENKISDAYIAKRYKGHDLPKTKAISLLKNAISDTAKRIPEAVGGHIFVYEITKASTTRLQ